MVMKKEKAKDEDDEAGVSFAPDDQTASSGLLSDVDVEFEEVECTTFDYNGKVKDKDGNLVVVPAIRIKMVADDGTEADQYLTCGDLDKLEPSEDGTTFVPVEGSTAKGIPSKSNAGIFMRSLGDAGFPFTHAEGLPEDFSQRDIQRLLRGMRAHVLRIEAPKKTGNMARSEKQKKYPDEVLTVTEIKRLPWEKKGKKDATATQKAGAKGKGKPAPTEDEDEDEVDIGAEAIEVVAALLGSPKHKKGISTEDIAELVFAATKTNPNRKKIIAAISEENFFEEADEFELDEDGTITLA